MHGGDAADEFVRIMLNGTEVAIRLTGSAAKNLAALLIAWSKNEKKVYGKTTMMKLLRSGDELRVLTNMTKDQYKEFKKQVGNKVLYSPFIDKKKGGDKLDIVIPAKSIPLINPTLKRIGYGVVEKTEAKEAEPPKKDTPSRPSSRDAADRSAASKDGQPQNGTKKKSVKEKLENFRRENKKREQKSPSRSHSKGKQKGRSR